MGTLAADALSRPPLVDLQVNGAFGVDFSSPDVTYAELQECCRAIVAGGTAAFLSTLVSCPEDTYRRNLPLLVRLCGDERLAGSVLGLHLEGPFLARDERVLGAHRGAHVRDADPALLDRLISLGAGRVRLITVAAEIPGAEALARRAVAHGVRVSIGHSYYDSDRLRAMYEAGARALTHLGNALPPSLEKQGNPLLAGLLADHYVAMFIGDGQHLSRELLRLLMRCLGPERLIAVSDASPVAGLVPGRYAALGQQVELRADGGVYNDAERHLVGSSRCLLEVVNTLLRLGVCEPADCVRMASTNPLAFLGLERDNLGPHVPTVTFDAAQAAFVVAREVV
jgi:N-acetylglucosamine-6-phosphate deacetylase